MPQGRILLKSISQSYKVAQLRTDTARLLYSWLIPHVDVNGNFYGDAVTVNALVFTRLAKSFDEVEDALQDLTNNGLIVRYEKGGETFLTLPNFTEKQPSLNPSKEGKATIPLFTPDLLPTSSRPTLDQVGTNSLTSKVKESKGKESKDNNAEGLRPSAILASFNLMTGQNRQLTSETVRLLSKLIKKGYTLDEFQAVIKFKRDDFSRDDKMRKYIRPATFFAEARFEDYLEQVRAIGKRTPRIGENPNPRKWTPEEREGWRKSAEREIRKTVKDEPVVQEALAAWDKRNPA
jgi:uncharacterized phage protein (TIGR02220 family)